MHFEVQCIPFKLCYEALHTCVVCGAALPNSSGGPVLDDTRTLWGVHLGTCFHLDTTHQPAEVRSGSLLFLDGVVCNEEPDTGGGFSSKLLVQMLHSCCELQEKSVIPAMLERDVNELWEQ